MSKIISNDMEEIASSSPDVRRAIDKLDSIENELYERNENDLGPAVQKLRRSLLMRVSGLGLGAIATGAAALCISSGFSWIPQIAIVAACAVAGGAAGESITWRWAHRATQDAIRREQLIQIRIENLIDERDRAMEQIAAAVARYMHPEHKSGDLQVYIDSKNYIEKPTSYVDAVTASDKSTKFMRDR